MAWRRTHGGHLSSWSMELGGPGNGVLLRVGRRGVGADTEVTVVSVDGGLMYSLRKTGSCRGHQGSPILLLLIGDIVHSKTDSKTTFTD